MILSAQTIRSLGIFSPFSERAKANGMSYGLSIAGYDVRADIHAMMNSPASRLLVDPGEFVLISTIEKFTMPNNVMGFVHDKSTWARRGLAVQNTVIEPGWIGYLTLELTNHSQESLVIEHGDPIAQIVLQFTDLPVEKPYSGKYQRQDRGPQEARFE